MFESLIGLAFGDVLDAFIYAAHRLLVLAVPLLVILAGENLVILIRGAFKLPALVDGRVPVPRAVSAVLGLVVYVTAIFLFRSIGLPWLLGMALPLSLAFLRKDTIARTFQVDYLKPGLNFVLWFFVVAALGTTMFQAVEGIQTPWTNNYGDLTFHLGLITSFVYGDNVPPLYAIFSGTRLSYPFFVDLWAAAEWSLSSDFKSLSFIFAVHWTFVWCLIYYLLNGNRYRLLPWALLFGGGAWVGLGLNSGQLIPHGVPWTSFLTTIWVTQRAAMMGACVSLAAVRILVQLYSPLLSESPDENRVQRKFLITLTGALLALSPLVHTHFFLTTSLCAGLFLLTSSVKIRRDGVSVSSATIGDVVLLSLIHLAALVFLPWTGEKAAGGGEMWRFTGGWITSGDKSSALETAARSILMWAECCWLYFFVVAVVIVMLRQWAWFVALTCVFILANLVQLAYWDWDQMKIFLALFMIFLGVWAWTPLEGERGRIAFWLQLACLGIIHPTLVEIIRLPYSDTLVKARLERWGAIEGLRRQIEDFKPLFSKGDNHTVYSAKEVADAEAVRRSTKPEDIVQGAPHHNSPLTLTGRKMFMGYEGTLSSHGLDYGKRRDLVVANPDLIRTCPEQPEFRERAAEICPRYLMWSDHERNFWKRSNPPREGLKEVVPGLLYEYVK